MAMPNQMVAEVEPGAGADTNSGWWAPLKSDNSTVYAGTDRTQSTTAYVTFNGTTITATIAATGATITITGYTVQTVDVGNTLRIASGTGSWTTGLFQIQSVNTGSNTWTLDRNVATGASSALVGTMGGALATLKQAFADITASVAVTSGSLNDCTIWYKSGTDTITSGLTIPVQYGLLVHGYQTTRGDNTGTRPLLTTATNSVNMITAAQSGNTSSATFNNVTFSNTAGTVGYGFYAPSGGVGRNITLINCKLSGFISAVFGNNNTNFYWGTLIMLQTEVASCTSDGVNNAGSNFLDGCYIHGNGATGLTTINPASSTCNTVLLNSVFATNTTHGVYFQGGSAGMACVAINCIFYNNTDAGIRIQSTAAPQAGFMLVNNIFQSNGTYGIDNQGNTSSFYGLGPFNRLNNFFYLNGAALNNLPAETTDITGTASAFVTAGSNFALNTTAGGGAACAAAGFPGVLPAGIGTGYISVGALQPTSAGSSGGMIINPGMSGGLD